MPRSRNDPGRTGQTEPGASRCFRASFSFFFYGNKKKYDRKRKAYGGKQKKTSWSFYFLLRYPKSICILEERRSGQTHLHIRQHHQFIVSFALGIGTDSGAKHELMSPFSIISGFYLFVQHHLWSFMFGKRKKGRRKIRIPNP